MVDAATLEWLAAYRFRGDVWGYPEGETFFPGSPVLTVEATFGEAVLLETLALSVLNHDSAIASAASRMTRAAGDRPCIEMGSRRTHEQAAVACARAAYVAGFAGTSNLRAGQLWGLPTSGTSAHAFVLVHDSERAAFLAQVEALGEATTLLVDTYDVHAAVRTAVEVAGPGLGAVRIDSGDLGPLAVQVRAELDELGAKDTRIIVTGDLDEHGIAGLAASPVDGYGVGTALGHGLRSADQRLRLQAGGALRRRRCAGAGSEEQPAEADPWRPQVGGPPGRRRRHGTGRAGRGRRTAARQPAVAGADDASRRAGVGRTPRCGS